MWLSDSRFVTKQPEEATMSLMELGVGHFRSPNMARLVKEPAPVWQLPVPEKCIIEILPLERHQRRRVESFLMLERRTLGRAPSEKCGLKIDDHSARYDARGHARCQASFG